MQTLVFLNPGHFHAALTLRKSDPRVGEEIFVYAEEGPTWKNSCKLFPASIAAMRELPAGNRAFTPGRTLWTDSLPSDGEMPLS